MLKLIITALFYATIIFYSVQFLLGLPTYTPSTKVVSPQYWEDTNKTYYDALWSNDYNDLLCSFVPKTNTYTMTKHGILEIGNGGFKRTL